LKRKDLKSDALAVNCNVDIYGLMRLAIELDAAILWQSSIVFTLDQDIFDTSRTLLFKKIGEKILYQLTKLYFRF